MVTYLRRSLLGVLAIGVLVASVGCAHSVVVALSPPQQAPAQKIPLKVGLYLPEGVKAYKVSESRMGDTWNYENLGQASATQFQLGLTQIFQVVELVNERPPFSTPKAVTLQAVIEPAIEKFEFDIPITKFQVYPAKIYYKVTVYDMTGKVIITKRVEGIGDTKGSPGFDFAENPSKAASKAVGDGVDKALGQILASPEIQALVKK